MNYTHEAPEYQKVRDALNYGKHNGAYYYSVDIVNNIIPNVKTSRPWVTIYTEGKCFDHAIYFVHKNVSLEKYDWLANYKDLILVCSVEETRKYMERFGKSILLPLSVDVDYVSQFKRPKIAKRCYAGNKWSFKDRDLNEYLPTWCMRLTNLPREQLLREIAKFEECYAVGRCAIEARVLGCKIKVCDSRFPDPSIWKVLDCKDAAKMLQKMLDEIDG